MEQHSHRAMRKSHRSDRRMFGSSDDNAMLKHVLSSHTHTPNDREFDIRPVLLVVEEIFRDCAPGLAPAAQAHTTDIHDDGIIHEMLEFLSPTINKVACEISCKNMSGGETHTTTMNVFSILSSYNWDAKAVVALAAFAVGYGEFYLVAQLYATNPLAKGIGALKQFPEILDQADTLKSKSDALRNLLNAMVELTKCIIEFIKLPSEYISPDTPELAAATSHFPTATYWIIRSVVSCASQITNLVGMGPEYMASTSETWDLSSLAHKISSIHDHLIKQLELCHNLINEKIHIDAYEKLVKLFNTPQVDNMKILQALFYAKDDQPPLIECSTKRRVGLDVLRRKNVLLLISEISIPAEELAILEQMYMESRQDQPREESQYEIVWIPVVNRSVSWTTEMQSQFEAAQAMMPWHSVHHPSIIDPAVIRYINEVWKFDKKAMLVVLDPQGKVANHNALYMMFIWGSVAYPFSSSREESLWKEESWRIELIADAIEPLIFNWISEEKYICLYGGEDIEWIRKFTATAQAVAADTRIHMEMLYVGKSNPREKVRQINTTIAQENLSHTLPDMSLIWFFWVRLESMWHSKVQTGKTVENDSIMQEIMTMLSYDGGDKGWAVVIQGSEEIAKSRGDAMLGTLMDYGLWKTSVAEKGFNAALKNQLYMKINTEHHCTRLILPWTGGRIPDRVVCGECRRIMETFIMYRCCTD